MQQLIADGVLQLAVARRGDRAVVFAEKLIAQAHAAHFYRIQIGKIMGIAHNQLGTAAADVDEQPGFLAIFQTAGHAQIDQARLFPPGNHGESQARMLPHPLQEGRGVLRVAHGGRGAGHDIRGAVGRAHARHALKHVNGALHGLFVQMAAQKNALAQTDHVLDLIEHRAGGIDRPHAHQHQTYGIAAQIKDAHDLAGPPGIPGLLNAGSPVRRGLHWGRHEQHSFLPNSASKRSPLTPVRRISSRQGALDRRHSSTFFLPMRALRLSTRPWRL